VHFEWTISLGQCLTIITFLGGVLHLHHQFVVMTDQHGMMWQDYIRRYGINGDYPQLCAAHMQRRSSDITNSGD
jgi:hypothetical protein